MLKRLIVNNFVKFKETQTIHFNNRGGTGVFFFVGANETGKSSIFEAVRRCSELRKNSNISSRWDDSKESLVICVFEGKAFDGTPKCLLSYYLLWAGVVTKALIVCCPDTKEPENVAFARSYLTDNIPMHWYEACNSQNLSVDMGVLTNCAATYDDENYIYDNAMVNEIISTLKSTYENNIVIERKTSGQQFDALFGDFIKMEFLFAHRGINLIQSSEQLEGTRGNRYKISSDYAYIIKNFLHTSTTDAHQQIYEVKKEREMFDLITSSTNREFILENNGVIKLKSEKGNAELLKVSEGIVEAKILSILLSKRGINALFLEEPGRGMHRDYTDILLDRILLRERFIGEKIIVMTTHNRDFVSPVTISNTIFFSKNDDGSCRINRLSSTQGKISRFVADDTVSSIFFSRHCIFVEGETDAIFVNAVEESVIDTDSMMHIITENVDEQNELRDFLATLRIKQLGGHKAKGKAEIVCKELGLERKRIFLLDRDVRKDLKDDLLIDESIDVENLTALDNKGIFLWNPKDYHLSDSIRRKIIKRGTLEDAMFETVCLHIDTDHQKGVTCMFDDCKASGYKKDLRKKGKDLLNEDDAFVRRFVRELVLYQTGQIWRFVKFLKNRSGLNHTTRRSASPTVRPIDQ